MVTEIRRPALSILPASRGAVKVFGNVRYMTRPDNALAALGLPAENKAAIAVIGSIPDKVLQTGDQREAAWMMLEDVGIFAGIVKAIVVDDGRSDGLGRLNGAARGRLDIASGNQYSYPLLGITPSTVIPDVFPERNPDRPHFAVNHTHFARVSMMKRDNTLHRPFGPIMFGDVLRIFGRSDRTWKEFFKDSSLQYLMPHSNAEENLAGSAVEISKRTALLALLRRPPNEHTQHALWFDAALQFLNRSIPLALVLCGGGGEACQRMMHHLQHRTPVIVIGGTGGFADSLFDFMTGKTGDLPPLPGLDARCFPKKFVYPVHLTEFDAVDFRILLGNIFRRLFEERCM